MLFRRQTCSYPLFGVTLYYMDINTDFIHMSRRYIPILYTWNEDTYVHCIYVTYGHCTPVTEICTDTVRQSGNRVQKLYTSQGDMYRRCTPVRETCTENVNQSGRHVQKLYTSQGDMYRNCKPVRETCTETVHQSGRHLRTLYINHRDTYGHCTPVMETRTYFVHQSVRLVRIKDGVLHSMHCTFTVQLPCHRRSQPQCIRICFSGLKGLKITTQKAVAEDAIVWYNRQRERAMNSPTRTLTKAKDSEHRQTPQ